MRGYPKTLNTKADYEYVKEHFSEDQWKPDWQALLDTSKDWFETGTVASAEDGLNDETHKVVEDEEEGKFIQMELKEIPMSKMNRLGFSEAEIKAALA